MKRLRTELYGQGFWDVRVWIFLGIIFVVLNRPWDNDIKSLYWFADFILYALLIVGLGINHINYHYLKLKSPKWLVIVSYVILVWSFGMLYEVSLTVTGEGIGGVHPNTAASFILAQGDYIPLAVISCFVIRHYHFSFKEVFFLAGGKSLTEGLIFTGVLTDVLNSSAFLLAPLVLAYYVLAYSCFIALPLLFIDERSLWKGDDTKKKMNIIYIWLLGFVLAFLIRLFWGLLYSPIVIEIFDLRVCQAA